MINLYVGVNGSGKSRLLCEIAKEKLSNDEQVIAIAMTNTDRFPRQNKNANYHYMGSRIGNNVAKKIIRRSISGYTGSKEQLFSDIFKTLKYVMFEEKIGIYLNGLRRSYKTDLHRYLYSSDFEERYSDKIDERDYLLSDIEYIEREAKYFVDDIEFEGTKHGIVITPASTFDYLRKIDVFSRILRCEAILRKSKVIKSIDLVVMKDHEVFPIEHSSSGELSILSVGIFISSRADKSAHIVNLLIDEPENSLHPEWQSKYLTNLKNLFPYHNIEYHVATHSPLLIAGAIEESDAQIFKHNGYCFTQLTTEVGSIEDSLIEQFGIITPKNNALSDRCIDIVNDVIEHKIEKETAVNRIVAFIDASFDSQQKEFLSGVIEIIGDIEIDHVKN